MFTLDFLFSKTKFLTHISGEEWIIEDSNNNEIYDSNGKQLHHILKRKSFDKAPGLYKIIGWTWLIEDKVWSPIVKNDGYSIKMYLNFKSKTLANTSSAGINYILHENYFTAEKFKRAIFTKWGEDAKIKEDKDFLAIKGSNETFRILPTLPPIDLRKNNYVTSPEITESNKMASQADVCLGVYKTDVNTSYINHFLKFSITEKKKFIERWAKKFIKYESEEELTTLLTILIGSGYSEHTGKGTYSRSIRIHSEFIPNSYSFRSASICATKLQVFIDDLKEYTKMLSGSPGFKLMKNSTYGVYNDDAFKFFNPCDEIPLFSIRNDGKFGMGNPTAKLHIKGITVDSKKTENDIQDEIMSKQYAPNYHKCDVNLGMDMNILLL